MRRLHKRGGRISSLETSQGTLTGDEYVVAAGNGSGSLLGHLGVRVPLCALKGYSLTLPYPEKAGIAPDISVTDYGHKIVYARLGQQLRIAAMVDIGYDGDELRECRIQALKNIVARSFPELEGLDEAALTGAVTRQDAAVVLCNALPEEYTPSFWDQPIDPTALSDWGRMDSLRQEAVAELARRCVIQGKADGSFGYADPLQRCDGAVLLMRVLEQVDNSCRGESQTVTLHILNADTGEALLPDQQVETEVSTYLSSLVNGLDVGYYVYDYDRETASYTSTACDSYTLYFRPMTGAEIQEEQFWEKVERGEAAYEDYYKQDFWLNFQGDNARKHILLFGDESKSRFASQEEAAAAMTTVTVPVWQLSGGEKVSSTLTLSVHAALAEDVKEIFTEIYNDPEHFPIHDVGGYAWRGDSATGEHNCGTAIDINANENYQIRDGQVLAGSCWEPGTNPRSISPDSSVVRIFAEHGWSWGGDAWAYSSDDSEGYHDYMHFSYMGE